MLKKNIPTSSVCSEDYFYDQDSKIENALAKMETMWSKALKNAIDDSCTIDDIESIREFVIYQISRTKAMLSHNREMATSMMKTLTLSMTGLCVRCTAGVNHYESNTRIKVAHSVWTDCSVT